MSKVNKNDSKLWKDIKGETSLWNKLTTVGKRPVLDGGSQEPSLVH